MFILIILSGILLFGLVLLAVGVVLLIKAKKNCWGTHHCDWSGFYLVSNRCISPTDGNHDRQRNNVNEIEYQEEYL